ncbi:MAG: exosortase-associated EpsI family protein [Opitutales bacterium]
MKKIILIVGALTVVFILGMQILVSMSTEEVPPLEVPLTEVLPDELGNWAVHSDELGAEDFADERVRAILQYDDSIVRTYAYDGTYFQVYLAYWKPGTAPYNRVGTHNPDTCWVNAGMTRLDRQRFEGLQVGGTPIKPAEYGRYQTPNGHEVDVIFWHLVGDGLYGYEAEGWDASIWGKIKRGLLVFDDFQRFGFNQRQQQYFLRVHTNRPLNVNEDGSFWNNEKLQVVMKDIVAHVPLQIGSTAGDSGSAVESAQATGASAPRSL